MDELDIPSYFSQLIIQTTSGLIHLPYVDIHRGEGEIVLITGGMDGDEYNGIHAAIQLGKQFIEDVSWKGRRVIFPIVNIPGFLVGVSFNPFDKKYPKYIYPGSKNGTVSEQIVFAILHYVHAKVDFWIDLHGGSRVETLYPFVWTFNGGSRQIQNTISAKLSNLDESSTIITTSWKKASEIQKKSTIYITLEAGHKGTIDQEMTKQLIQWTSQLLDPVEHNTYNRSRYSSVKYYSATSHGYWKPTIQTMLQRKGNKMGIHIPFNGILHEYINNHDSRVLWFHNAGWVQRRDILVATTGKKLRQ